MIFKETWQQVLDGTKTQTRRPVKPDEDGFGVGKHYSAVYKMTDWYLEMHNGLPCEVRDKKSTKWYVDQTLAIQPGRGKKAVGRIRITKIRRERLREISAIDVVKEGIMLNAGGETNATFLAIHRRKCDAKDMFAILWNSLYRKPYRWEDNPEVWALEFERSL